jgi:histone acetyltransferase (RNA polymerase elongator complex component)
VLPKEVVDKYESIIMDMLKEDITSVKEFDKFKVLAQRTYKISIKNVYFLKVYRSMMKKEKIPKNDYYIQFMRTKKQRGETGVIIVATATSPWPKTVEENYGLEVEGDVHKTDTFEKPELTKQLAKKYKKFSCKYDCFMCPDEPGQPRSYGKKEDTLARANQVRFDAILQVWLRGRTYYVTGHIFDKLEVIVLGGTITSYPDDYVEDFIRDTYYAANTFHYIDFDEFDFKDINNYKLPRPQKSLEEEIKINETAQCRIIGLTLETRPDQITPKELERYRRFGVTRVQIGIQHTDNEVLKYINRGCTIEDAIKAIRLLKDSCFKVDGHYMPDLPGSNPEKDIKMSEESLMPHLIVDQIKRYPHLVLEWTKTKIWYDNEKRNYDTIKNPEGLNRKENRRYKSYAEEELKDIKIPIGKDKEIYSTPLIEGEIKFMSEVPPWVRINRVQRDYPIEYIKGGSNRTDLRQIIEREVERRGLKLMDIRARQVRGKKTDVSKAELVIRKYDASGGEDYFISYESPDREILYGFLRLRLSYDSGSEVFPELQYVALMRELHVYGITVKVNRKDTSKINTAQHHGFGKKLIQAAEKIAWDNGYKKMAVIAGVGVRNYYRKQGYKDAHGKGNFQIKDLFFEDDFFYK